MGIQRGCPACFCCPNIVPNKGISAAAWSAAFDAAIAGALALGLTVYDEEVLHTNDGRIGREIGIVDFDDNLVVLYKILGEA